MGLFLPPALLLLVIAGLTQRVELVALRNAFLRHATSFDTNKLATETLLEECRNQTALLQDRCACHRASPGRRQAETLQTRRPRRGWAGSSRSGKMTGERTRRSPPCGACPWLAHPGTGGRTALPPGASSPCDPPDAAGDRG